MNITLGIVASLVAGGVGYAMKRGGLCTYAAVKQIVGQGRFDRLAAFVGASAWATLLLCLLAATWLAAHVTGMHLNWPFAVAGGVLLGFGAWLNRGCVFGTFVQLVGGNLDYLATLVGMAVASVLVRSLAGGGLPTLDGTSPLLSSRTATGAALVGAGLLLGLLLRRRRDGRRLGAVSGQGRVIMLVLGVGGGWLFATLPGWDFAAVINRLAYRQAGLVASGPHAAAVGTTLAMVAGGVLAALLSGSFVWRLPRVAGLLRCLGGGALMGAGALLAPGGNDTLLLAGIPALAFHAALAWGVMVASMLLLLRALPNDGGYRMPAT